MGFFVEMYGIRIKAESDQDIQGAQKKNNSLAKSRYFDNRLMFLHDFFPVYRGDNLTCLRQISLQNIHAFKSYEVSTKKVEISN